MTASEDFYKVRNRETLKKLASGMEITRATKHEPIDFNGLSHDELRQMTDDRNGSKFLLNWTLPRLVEWLEQQAISMDGLFHPEPEHAYGFRWAVMSDT